MRASDLLHLELQVFESSGQMLACKLWSSIRATRWGDKNRGTPGLNVSRSRSRQIDEIQVEKRPCL